MIFISNEHSNYATKAVNIIKNHNPFSHRYFLIGGQWTRIAVAKVQITKAGATVPVGSRLLRAIQPTIRFTKADSGFCFQKVYS